MPDGNNSGVKSENVVGVRFQKVGKVYHFSATGVGELNAGDFVVVDTIRGQEVGQVVQVNLQSCRDGYPLKPVARRATAQDMALLQRFRSEEREALVTCRQKTEELGLPMSVAKVEYNYNGRNLTVFFMADGKVDYQPLKRALAQRFRVKVRMRPIGARDLAKMLGGCGACGGPLCCSTFLTEFVPVSIKTAKAQDVTLVPSEITGMCGRLRCCLRYEYRTYEEVKQAMPQEGREVVTTFGRGRIVQTNALKETAVVDLGKRQVEVPLAGLKVESRGCHEGCPSAKRG